MCLSKSRSRFLRCRKVAESVEFHVETMSFECRNSVFSTILREAGRINFLLGEKKSTLNQSVPPPPGKSSKKLNFPPQNPYCRHDFRLFSTAFDTSQLLISSLTNSYFRLFSSISTLKSTFENRYETILDGHFDLEFYLGKW